MSGEIKRDVVAGAVAGLPAGVVSGSAGAAGVFPFLIGHPGYGAGLGITFYLLEARYRPWWIPRGQAQVALVARAKSRC